MRDSERGMVVSVYYYGPPAVGIAAQRLRGYAEHLPEFGWDLVVIAPTDVHYHRSTDGTSRLPDHTRVVHAANPEPSRWLRGLWGGGDAPATGDVRRLDPAGSGDNPVRFIPPQGHIAAMLIRTEQTPNPATRKFLPGETVMEIGSRDFPDAESAEASPLAQSVCIFVK